MSDRETGIVTELTRLPPGAIIYEEKLAAMLGTDIKGIRGAVERLELPPAVSLLGRRIWTAHRLQVWLDMRQAAAARTVLRLADNDGRTEVKGGANHEQR